MFQVTETIKQEGSVSFLGVTNALGMPLFCGFIWFGALFSIPITDAEVVKCSAPCLPEFIIQKRGRGINHRGTARAGRTVRDCMMVGFWMKNIPELAVRGELPGRCSCWSEPSHDKRRRAVSWPWTMAGEHQGQSLEDLKRQWWGTSCLAIHVVMENEWAKRQMKVTWGRLIWL